VRNAGDIYQPGLGLVEPFVNKSLFADNFLKERLSDLPEWTATDRLDESLRAIQSLYREKAARLSRSSEPQTEREFIRPILDILWGEEGPGDCYEVQPPLPNVDSHRWPDFAFFRSSADRESAEPRKGTLEYWCDAPCLGDAKKWSASLDKQRGVAENPSTQIVNYLYRSRVRWGILTNGRIWRLYEREKSSPGGVYYEVNLEDILRRGDIEAFKYFYLFFRRQAFLPDDTGTTLVEKVFQGSVDYATGVGERLKDYVYDALRHLMNGFLAHPANSLDPSDADTVKDVHENCLVLLYRLLFILYAEDRNLLPCDDRHYRTYCLRELHRRINQELRARQQYLPHTTGLWNHLANLFALVDRGFPEGGIPAYNGGLFSPLKYPHIAYTPQDGAKRWEIGDHRLAEVIDMLAYCREKWDQPTDQDIDYKTLDVQHLGSIYESLLELQPHVADEPMVEVLEDGKSTFKPRRDVPEPRPIRRQMPRSIAKDEVYLLTNRGERKATGSYYTPKYIVDYIVQNTISPLADEAAKKAAELRPAVDKEIERLEKRCHEFADNVVEVEKARRGIEEQKRRLLEPYLSLKVLDPAMGSGHFLVGAADFLSLAMANDPNLLTPETADSEDPQAFYKRLVVEHCLYGVDLNPLAVELAKLSLWLHTVSRDKALSFLDHHLRCGNSLIGARIQEDLMKEPPRFNAKGKRVGADGGQLVLGFYETLTATHLQYFLDTFRKIVETPTGDAETERMKDGWYREMDARRDKFRAVANCWLAPYFGVPVTPEQYERAVKALRAPDEEWRTLSKKKWFAAAQKVAGERVFFHWELEFLEAFFEPCGLEPAEARGFDAVIGNPPYVQARNMDAQQRKFYYQRYESAVEKIDVFAFFCENLCALLLPSGSAGFVLSSSWLGQTSFTTMRRILFTELRPRAIAVNPSNAFDASVETVDLLLSGKQSSLTWESLLLLRLGADGHTETVEDVSCPIEVLKPDYVIRFGHSREGAALLQRIEKSSIPLGMLAQVNYGLKTGDDALFVSTERLGHNPRKVIYGEDVDCYAYDWPGLWVNYMPKEMVAHRPTARPATSDRFEAVPKLIFKRISQHRLCAALDEEGIYCTISTIVATCFQADTQFVRYVLACVNSRLMLRYLSWKRPKGFLSTDLRTEEVNLLPIRRTAFTTPPDERERLVIEAKQLCDNYISAGDSTRTLEFVQEQLAHTPERADVVHDLLAHLAERMTAMNKEKQAEIKGFLMWLERYIGAEIESLSGKTKIKEYHDGDFQSLLNTLRRNRRKLAINPETRTAQEEIEREFNTGMAKLTPLKEKIAATDRLIDLIVYRLYGLTDEEIKIVEGEHAGAEAEQR